MYFNRSSSLLRHGLSLAVSLLIFGQQAAANEAFLRIRAVGDMMIGNAPSNEIPNHNFFANVSGLLNDSDITFGNHEGTLCDDTILGRKCKADAKPGQLCYAFRTPTRLISQFKDAGFTVLNLANNHIFDYYERCADQTKKTIEDAGIHSIGLLDHARSVSGKNTIEALKETARIVERKGKRIAFIGFHYSTVYSRVVSVNEIPLAKRLVQSLKAENDLVVVSMHAGAEGAHTSHTPNQNETHMGENRGNMIAFSRAVVDSGADLVIGHGPHVLRGMEVYKDRLIIYSLGNFATYTHFSFNKPMDLGAIVEAGINENGELVSGKIFSTYQYWKRDNRGNRIHVVLDVDSRKQAETELIKWSNADFASSAPIFDNKGNFYPSNTSSRRKP